MFAGQNIQQRQEHRDRQTVSEKHKLTKDKNIVIGKDLDTKPSLNSFQDRGTGEQNFLHTRKTDKK